MHIQFTLAEKSRVGKCFLEIEYMGGDADTEHFEEIEMLFSYAQVPDNLGIIQGWKDKFEIIEALTDGSGGHQDHDYDELVEAYGKEIAIMYDNVPNDPQNDYQFKTSLCCVSLIGYDSKGNKYKAQLI